MKYFLLILCIFLLFCGCSANDDAIPTVVDTEPIVSTAPTIHTETIPAETTPPDPIRELMNAMSLEERVGQLFLVRCDDSVALEHIETYHLGGFVLFGRDFDKIYYEKIRPYINSGHIMRTKKGYAFTPQGMYVSNYILSRIIDFDMNIPGI